MDSQEFMEGCFKLTARQLISLLDSHSIPATRIGDNVWARDEYTSGNCLIVSSVEVTDWTSDKLMSWLGY